MKLPNAIDGPDFSRVQIITRLYYKITADSKYCRVL